MFKAKFAPESSPFPILVTVEGQTYCYRRCEAKEFLRQVAAAIDALDAAVARRRNAGDTVSEDLIVRNRE